MNYITCILDDSISYCFGILYTFEGPETTLCGALLVKGRFVPCQYFAFHCGVSTRSPFLIPQAELPYKLNFENKYLALSRNTPGSPFS